MKYRKKPVVIEAVQLRWVTWNDVCAFVGDAMSPGRYITADEASDTCGEQGPYIAILLLTTHGEEAVVRHGDWIIPDSKPGTFYPCKPDVFAETYEPVNDRADKLAALKDKFASIERSALVSGEQTPDVCPCVMCKELRAQIAECSA